MEQEQQQEYHYEEEFNELNLEQELVQPTRLIKTQNGEKSELTSTIPKDSTQEGNNPKKHLQKPKKPLSAYFIFIQDYKQKSGGKINLKEMGAIWNETSQDEKQIYYKKQEEEKNRFKREMEEYVSSFLVLAKWKIKQLNKVMMSKLNNHYKYFKYSIYFSLISNEEQLDNELDIAFPISRIKGILKADEDNKLLSKDVLLHFEKATELFGSYLAQKCFRNMQQNRRKKLQTSDLFILIFFYQNLDESIKKDMYLNFLSCIIPQEETIPEEEGQNQQNEVVGTSQQSSKTKAHKKLIIADDENENKDNAMEVENVVENEKYSPLNSSAKKNVKQNIKPAKPAKKEKVVQAPVNNRKIDSFFNKK